jgi:hypothetical protein
MAARKRKTTKPAIDESYSKLDQYAIELNEFYKSLRKAGFSVENALWLLASPDARPSWIQEPTLNDITQHMEDEEE